MDKNFVLRHTIEVRTTAPEAQHEVMCARLDRELELMYEGGATRVDTVVGEMRRTNNDQEHFVPTGMIFDVSADREEVYGQPPPEDDDA